MQFEFICPTNFSLSPDLDKLKLVGHQTASLFAINLSRFPSVCPDEPIEDL